MAKSPISVAELIRALETHAPSGTAEDWDNVGLLVGDPKWKTTGAVVSVDLTQEAIDAARSKKFRLIVTHHPCIFPRGRGLSRVDSSSLVFKAIRQGIAVACYHTNFDRCALEVVKKVASGLGVKPQGRLIDNSSESLIKLVVFVPSTHVQSVRAAICEAGAGQIGNYDFCTFGAEGMGTFRGGSDAQPFLGKPGRLETAKEVRLETIFPRGLKTPVVSAMKAAHPYEEVAFDLYAVEQAPAPLGVIRGLGYGFFGEFPSPKPFSELTKSVKRLFNVNGFWMTDPPPARVKRLAFVAGKGASFLNAASSVGCDLLITGEVGYHAALDGQRKGMAVMELGHRESEKFFLSTMAGWLSAPALRLKTIELDLPTQRIVQRL